MIGREAELAAARRAVDGIDAGAGVTLIEGEPGIGKSLLAQTVVGVARERGLRVLEARPVESEAQLSYAALGDLLGPVFEIAAAELPPPQRRALEVALLVAGPEGEAPDQRAIAVAALGALRRLADGGGVVLAIDDLQWLDADSARVIAFALRRIAGERLAAVLTRRAMPGAELPGGLDVLLRDPRVTRVPLAPLTPGELHVLIRGQLGWSLARPLLLRIHATAGGNPLYALEICAALDRSGREPDEGAPLPLPETLAGVLDERLALLSAGACEALAAMAALAQPTRAVVAAAGAAGEEGLREAISERMVEPHGERLRFAHPLYGSAATARLGEAERRALHSKLAAVVDDPEEAAAHLALAVEGPDPATAARVAEAARRAAARGAPEAALALAEHALRLTPAGADRDALALKASDYAFAAGDTERARRLLDGATAAESPATRSRAFVLLSTLATYDGSMLEARDLAGRALDDAGGDPAHLVMVHRRLALAHLLLAELATAERHARAAVELAERGRDQPALARALANQACICVLRGRRGDAEPALRRALELEDAPGIASIDDSPSAVAGLLLMYAGELDAARRHLVAGLAGAQHHGGDPLSTGLLFALSELESRAGRFGEAAELARRGLAASEQSGQVTERAVLLFASALADAHLGHADAARDAAEEGLAIAGAAAQRFAEAQNRWALGFLEAGLGRPLEAWNVLEPAIRMLRDNGIGELGAVPVHVEGIEALAALGRLDEARALLAELEQTATTRWLAAAACRCRGTLLAAGGRFDEAVAELERAARESRELGLPFEHARALLSLGATQRRAKRRGDARGSLEAALAVFEELGAAPWAERARGEMARLGGRRASHSDELTETERQIAELAADGRSNKEIGGELFVSERTVEANLTRAYRKLGVRSRTELARRLPAG